MRVLRAFLLGAAALGITTYALAAVLATAAASAGRSLDLAIGPVTFVVVSHGDSSSSATYGPGLLALALVGGLLNMAAARAFVSRPRGRADAVD